MPDQDKQFEQWQRELLYALSFNTEHLSLYQLND